MMKKTSLLLWVFVLALCAFIIYSCNTAVPEADTGNSHLPSDDLATWYVHEHHLLATITDMKKVPTRFVLYGPGFLQVTGRDEQGRDAYVWLIGDTKKTVGLVGQALAADGLTELQARDAVSPFGTVEQIFLSPIDYKEFLDRHVIAWHIHLFNGQDAYVNFKTGKRVDLNKPEEQ